jgi:hypothetical protein
VEAVGSDEAGLWYGRNWRLLASGGLELPIKARFPLERVADAYREVANRHDLGKVVLEISAPCFQFPKRRRSDEFYGVDRVSVLAPAVAARSTRPSVSKDGS